MMINSSGHDIEHKLANGKSFVIRITKNEQCTSVNRTPAVFTAEGEQKFSVKNKKE
jgi:hypothetical protein